MKQLMDSRALEAALSQISAQILSAHPQAGDLAMLGIRAKGKKLAQRIAAKLKERAKLKLKVGTIDTSLYRDDVNVSPRRPVLCRTEISFPVTDKKIILVDDVLYTGRTIRAALDAVMDLGRPSCIQLAVLVDRGHRELPIHADYVGLVVATSRRQSVRVILQDDPGRDEVILIQEPEARKW